MILKKVSTLVRPNYFSVIQSRNAAVQKYFGKNFNLKGLVNPLPEFWPHMVGTQHKTFIPLCLAFCILYPFIKSIDEKCMAEEYSQFFNKTRLYGKHNGRKGEKWKHPQFPWIEEDEAVSS